MNDREAGYEKQEAGLLQVPSLSGQCPRDSTCQQREEQTNANRHGVKRDVSFMDLGKLDDHQEL